MVKFFSNIFSAILGLWLAEIFIQGVRIIILPESAFFGISIDQQWKLLLVLGVALGLINFFIKPIISGITLPLRLITLGFFGIVINMAMIWTLDIMFEEIAIPLWLPLLETSLVIWAINFIFLKIFKQEN